MPKIIGEDLTIRQLVDVARRGEPIDALDKATTDRMQASATIVEESVTSDQAPLYGVTTGFGPLATVRIEPEQVRSLSRNVVLSSMVGVGPPLGEDIVRAMMLIRLNTFAKGLSGVRPLLAETIRKMLNAGVTPSVPSKGSLGASGDLAPLAHIAAVVSAGKHDDESGQAWFGGELLSGAEAMERAGIDRVVLEAKEGLELTPLSQNYEILMQNIRVINFKKMIILLKE